MTTSCAAGQGSCIAMASRYPKAYRSITLLCFAVDASDQSVSRYCNRLVPTGRHMSVNDISAPDQAVSQSD
jgi:hypothetical protein